MTLALYRKYRPRTFSEIIGQEHVTEPLSQALRTGRLHHAYLFSGPRGCGKTSSARILARSLNCEKGPTPDPCGECASCIALAPDGPGSIDVIEIDAASHGGVDDARDLRERAFFAPVSSRYKIYVIDEAHMVSSAGFNALLKLVEEPPDYVKFVFATTEPEKVLGTIKSRTHHYPFRLIPPSVLRPYLESLCESEGVKAEANVFPLVVRAGGGSARDSLSILDQLIAGAGPEGVTYARAVALLGVTDVTLIDEVCDALAAGDGAAVFSTIDRVVEAGHDPRRFAGDLLARLRDLIVMQQVPDAVSKGLLDGAEDELTRMESQAQRFGPATLSRMADVVHTGLTDMRGTTSPRLVLELIAARMLLPGAEDSTGALLHRLERMERRLTSSEGDLGAPTFDRAAEPVRRSDTASLATGAPRVAAAAGAPAQATAAQAAAAQATVSQITASPATASRAADTPVAALPAAAPPVVKPPVVKPPVAAPSAAQATARPPAASQSSADAGAQPPAAAPLNVPVEPRPKAVGALDAADIRREWDLVLTYVRRAGARVWAYAREAVVRDVVDGNTLVLVFQHQFHAQALASEPKLLVDALTEVFGGAWQIRCELAGQQGAISTPAPAMPSAASREPASDDDWPVAAPIGRDEPEPVTDEENGWPAAVRPPSAPAADMAANAQTTPAPARISRPAKASPSKASPRAEVKAPPRAAAEIPTSTPNRAGPQASARSAPAPVTEFGFDAGDEPLDDEGDGDAIQQSSEEQAIDLLKRTLGAEKI